MGSSDALRAFRRSFYECFHRRSDALFELVDAILSADGTVPSPAHLSLQVPHRRGWGSLYAALWRGRIDYEALRKLLARLPLAGTEGEPFVYAYYEGIPVDGYEFWYMPSFAMLAPSNDGLTHVATADFATEGTEGTPEQRFERVLDALPELRERVQGAERRTPFVAHRYSPVLHRQAYGPGWALVGDARFYQSDWNGYGMSHAFRDAERLATALHEWLSGAAAYESALAGYEHDAEEWSRPFLDTVVACVTAIREGRPFEAPWNGMAPAAQAWLERLRAGQP
jgi:2-polyprenyl-6-methoxyphenol hydroxylase-like FAD-dependent oxidoreductase